MKAARSQTKVLFAYQLKESQASLQNPGLSSTSTNTCIRVVQYLNLGAYFNDSQFDDASVGRGSLKTDFLSSAIITSYTTGSAQSNKLNAINDPEPGAVQKIAPCLYKNYRIVDIILSPVSAIITSLSTQNAVVGVLIGLQFDSGSTDDLFLTVVSDPICSVDLDSDYTRSAANVVGGLVDAGYGSKGSIELNTEGSISAEDTFFAAFSWAKYYKQARAGGELAEPGCLQVNDSEYNPTHQQFYTTWGVAVPVDGTPLSPSSQQWALNNDYYASPEINIMPWVTGRADLTKSILYAGANLETNEEAQCLIEHNPLGRFFGISAPFSGNSHNATGTGSQYVFEHNSAADSWGQQFGWLTTPPGFVVKDRDGQVITSNRVWGTSPAFTAAVNPGKTHSGLSLNQSLGDPDTLYVPYAELSKSWFGSFPSDYQGYMEAGDAGTTSITPIAPGAGSSLSANQSTGSNALNRDPLKRRFNRLFHRTEMYSGSGASAYNNNWYVSGFEGGTETSNNLLYYAAQFRDQSGSAPSNSNNYYVTLTNRDYASNGYAWITSATIAAGLGNPNSPLRKSNSLIEVRANRGVNFFYTGATFTDEIVLSPVFKGHGKIIKLLRASGFGSPNISSLVYAAADQHATDGLYTNFRDVNSYIAATQFYDNATVNKRFNGIDLLFNLIYRNYGYPDDLRLYGKGSEQFFNGNEALNTVVVNTYYSDSDLSSGEVNIEGSQVPFQGRVQDIAYLVEGWNRAYVLSTTNYNSAAYSLNHPLETAWSNRGNMGLQSNIYINLEASEHRPFQMGPGQITHLAENENFHAKAIYSAGPIGGSLGNFGAPSIGNSPNFAHSYLDSYYNYGNTSEDYPNGGSDLSGRQLKLPSTDPTSTEHRNSIILDPAGEKEIIRILGQSVVVQNLSGAGDTDTGFPQVSANNQNLQIEFVMRYQYTDEGTTEFQTAGGDREVTTTSVPVLANRVTKVLEVWNHIEVIPLSRLSEDSTVNSFGVDGQPSFAYRQSITSADHVDDISIEQVTGFGSEVYELRVKIRADENDIYNNPEYELGAEDNPFTAIIPDVPYDVSSDYRAGRPSAWKTGYEASDIDADNGSSKASFIVVAHASTWEDTGDFTVSSSELVGPKSTSYVLQTPYVTYGGFTAPEVDPFVEVPGCTDPTALNYNAEANTDDGSCQFCGDELLNTFNNFSIDSGWNVGAYQPNEDHHMFNGLVAGLGSSYSNTLPGSSSANPYLGSNELLRGGTVMCNNAFIGENALCNLSIKGKSHSGIENFTTALDLIQNTYSETAESCWRLRIIPMTDAITDDIPFTTGPQVQGVINADNVPSSIAAATAIYDSYANGGTLQNPEWNNIAEESTAGLSGNLKAGNPYLLEMIFDPTKLDGIACNDFLTKDFRMYGMFWTAFCSCASTDNDYYTLALNNNGYDWNSSSTFTFPVLPYGGGNTSDCPDAIPGNLLDDGPYFGTAPDAANATVCFQNDDELISCDTYFLSCVVGPFIDCALLTQVEDGTVTPIDLGNGEFQLPFTASIEVNLEGVYDAQANQLLSTDNIQYNVTVSGPEGYSETQTQADTDYDVDNNPFYINIFDNLTVEGTYIVDVELTAPYPNDIQPEGYPCSDQFEIIIENPCATYIEGCTDPLADNYDPLAIQDNGTCSYSEPCEDVYLNTSLSFATSTANSTSSCGQDTITFEGVSYDINVPVPNNDGTVTVSVTYESNEGAVSAYAIALIAQGSPLIGILNNQAEVMEVVFANYPTSLDTEGVDLTGTAGSQIAFWSPLFQIGDVPNPNSHTFTGIAPGNYFVLVVPDVQTDSLDPGYLECPEEPFLKFEDYLTSVFVGQDAAPDCEEECLNPPCIEYTYGCTNPNAENYDETADYDDGSCIFTETFCEQNPNDALCEDCTAANEAGGAQSRSVGVRQTDGSLDETVCDPTVGTDGECTDPNACNYNPNAPLDVSNNLLCDYCSCIEDQEDPDCFPDTGCDPAIDPNCGPPQPECPDPSNPACDPEPFDPCPTGDCIPPGDPCLILGNCGGTTSDDPDDFPDFVDDINPVEVTCLPDIDAVDESEIGFSAIQEMAFKCMGEEGTKLLFKLKAGVDCSQEELTKLSLIAYLFAGGLENTLLPCLFNCNYESQSKLKERNCVQKWVAGGARVWNGVDTFQQGDYCVYYYQKNGVVTRSYYEATRDIEVRGLQPRYPGSGWHRCQDVKLRKADRNGIADGTENYLTVMYEYLTRYCTSCQIGSNGSDAQTQNGVDQSSSQGYLPPKTNADERNNINTGSGILGEDGEEIIF